MESLFEQASHVGFEHGVEAGYQQGMERGIQEGMEQGIEQGIAQGMERGIEQGGRAVKAEIVRRMLEMGLPESQIARAAGIEVGDIPGYRSPRP